MLSISLLSSVHMLTSVRNTIRPASFANNIQRKEWRNVFARRRRRWHAFTVCTLCVFLLCISIVHVSPIKWRKCSWVCVCLGIVAKRRALWHIEPVRIDISRKIVLLNYVILIESAWVFRVFDCTVRWVYFQVFSLSNVLSLSSVRMWDTRFANIPVPSFGASRKHKRGFEWENEIGNSIIHCVCWYPFCDDFRIRNAGESFNDVIMLWCCRWATKKNNTIAALLSPQPYGESNIYLFVSLSRSTNKNTTLHLHTTKFNARQIVCMPFVLFCVLFVSPDWWLSSFCRRRWANNRFVCLTCNHRPLLPRNVWLLPSTCEVWSVWRRLRIAVAQ